MRLPIKNRHILIGAKLLISIVLISILYRNIPLPELRAQLANIHPGPLLPVFFLLLLNTALSATKWRILLKADGVDVPFFRLFTSYMVGNFFNMFLPSTVGGDAYRVYDIARLSGRPAHTFASVFADRLAGFLALAFLALAAAFPVVHLTGKPMLMLLPAATTLAIMGGIFLLSKRQAMTWLMRLTRVDRVQKLDRLAGQCMDSWDVYRNRPDVLLRIMLISFTFQTSLVCCICLLSRALGATTPLIYFFAFVPLITLLEAIPITIFGIGLRDAGYAFFFPLAGMGQIPARLLAVLVLIANVLYSMIGGIIILFKPADPARTDAPPASGLHNGRRAAVAAAVALLVWGCFTWPLPRYTFTGIPSSPVRTETQDARRMVAGDHLQLMYHFWLAADMLRGKTALFHNVYEFNTGDDDARYEPGAYYLPFSFVYAIGSWVGGRAFGWNLAGWVSVWLTFLLTWLLARRYTADETAAFTASLISLTLPYRWLTLLGGSPTGFAIALVPLLLLGLDRAVREDRAAGGAMAGTAILLAFCSDLHVFAFCVFVTPFWCLVAFAARDRFAWTHLAAYRKLACALSPAAVLAFVAFLLSRATAAELDSGVMAGGWPLREVHALSPWRRGFLTWQRMGVTNQIYIGYTVAAVAIVGATVMAIQALRRRQVQRLRLLVPLLVGVGVAGICALALGTDGPVLRARAAGGDITPLVIARKLIPPYRMIRQPAKIFCLMPTILAIAAVFPLTAILATVRRRWGRVVLSLLVAAGIWTECRSQLDPAICLLDNTQGAYAETVADAHANAITARALVVPLWPGNSHWASIYQHYASLYHLRLVNGYRPSVPTDYVTGIFEEYESINQGKLSNTQADALLARGISHVLLHEDAFPEQVSPFPVGTTLERLTQHPRLKLIAHDRGVWTFRLLAQPTEDVDTTTTLTTTTHFPSPRWHVEMERARATGGSTLPDRSASSGLFLQLAGPAATTRVTYRARVGGAAQQNWWIRMRGRGTLSVRTRVDGNDATAATLSVDTPDWRWFTVALPDTLTFGNPEMLLTLASGTVDLDLCLLAAGPWDMHTTGTRVDIRATSCFHAGYSDPAAGVVVLRRDDVPNDQILYAPLMPLAPGTYETRLISSTPAPSGTRLGTLTVATTAGTPWQANVVAGKATRLPFRIRENLPVRIGFTFSRAADTMVHELSIVRAPGP